MDKNSKYSTIALSFLVVTVLAVGGAFYWTNNKISADVQTPQSFIQDDSFPLKYGWNEMSGLSTIVTLNSINIVSSQGTYTYQEAVDEGIIEKVVLKEGEKELGKDLDYVPLKQAFLVFCKNIENTPKLLVK